MRYEDLERNTASQLASPQGFDLRLLRRLPAFSPIAVRLLCVLAEKDVSFKAAARLIALDPVLAGEVLRLANSGLYGRRQQVCSILHAIAMLGIGKLSQIAATAALWRGLPNRSAPFVREWWRHSIAAAFVARECGQGLDMDFAYTAGLLHGVGQLALFVDAPQDYPNLVERVYSGELNLLDVERGAFGVDHASLGRLLLESWGLPGKLCEAVSKHHAGAGGVLVQAVKTGCAGAEYALFGRCGCAKDIPATLADLFAGDYKFDTLITEVNQVECSLG